MCIIATYRKYVGRETTMIIYQKMKNSLVWMNWTEWKVMECIPGNLFGRQCMRNIKWKQFRLGSSKNWTSPKGIQVVLASEGRLNCRKDK